MNRRKKVNSILKRRAKRGSGKAAPSNKTPYISKADREKIQATELEKNSPEHNV